MIRLRFGLACLVLSVATAKGSEEIDPSGLWPPPSGGKRAVLAASQQLWWDKDSPKARKDKARALDFSGRYAEAGPVVGRWLVDHRLVDDRLVDDHDVLLVLVIPVAVTMAIAMKNACIAGRLSFLAGRIGKKLYAQASSPMEGLIS